MMKSERWRQIDEVFQAALERPPEHRAAFIGEACGDDDSLRLEVEKLLAADGEAGSLIETPAYAVAAPLIVEDDLQLLAGKTIGHYQIISFLGKGGMGEVYLARDTRLIREVAIKVLPSEYSTDTERLRRFEQEARVTSATNHPNILTVYDIGSYDGSPYIVEELLNGEDLHKALKREPIPLLRTLDYAQQIASGLAAAHAKGVVHRDLKPENLFVTADGFVKILDFGLAKLRPPESIHDSAALTQRKATDPGMVMGTASYMSPEQARGQEVDARSDIFSLGVVLYEMIAGRAPFTGANALEVVGAILNQEAAPLRQHCPDTPSDLQRIVSKTLRKDREQRYQHVKDLLIDLKDLKEELEFEARLKGAVLPDAPREPATAQSAQADYYTALAPALAADEPAPARESSNAKIIPGEIKPRRQKLARTLLIFILVTAGIAFGLYRLLNLSLIGSDPSLPFQQIEMTRLTVNGVLNFNVIAISPDGKYVAYVLENGQGQSLWVRQVSTTSNLQIVAPASVSYVSLEFSQDGEHLYYVSVSSTENALYQVSVLGGLPRKLLTDVGYMGLSPDSNRIAFFRYYPKQGERALVISDIDGKGEKRLITRKLADVLWSPAWSPDGKFIACAVGLNSGGQGYSIVVVNVESGTQDTISTRIWPHIGSIAWLPDRSGLLITGHERSSSNYRIWHISYPSGDVRKITNDLNDYSIVKLAQGSNTLVTIQGKGISNIWITPNGDTSRARQLTFRSSDGYWGMDWASDNKIVYVSAESGNEDIWIMNQDGTNPKQLTFDNNKPSKDSLPSVSPDGRFIVFISDRDGPQHIWRMDIDGSNQKQLTTGSSQHNPSCSPDGKWVVYSDNSSGMYTLWKISIDGKSPVQLSNKLSASSTISPDGKLIAYITREKGTPTKIELSPFEGGMPIKTFDFLGKEIFNCNLRWTPDGKALSYIDTELNANGNISKIWLQPINGDHPKQLTDFKSDRIFSFAWSRDGKQLALSRGRLSSEVVLIRDIR